MQDESKANGRATDSQQPQHQAQAEQQPWYQQWKLARWIYVLIEFCDRRSGFITAVATVAIAGFTIVLAGVSARQWQALQIANLNSERFFELAQSPYVFLKNFHVDPPKVGEKLAGSVQISNSGNLPVCGELLILGKSVIRHTQAIKKSKRGSKIIGSGEKKY